MAIRSASSSSLLEDRPPKRVKLQHSGLTLDDFKDGVMLAPMVRSGCLPTRLFALKHGAKLVWSPEIVDKAILHAERVVDPRTGVVSYNGKSKAMFTTHPIEKPYLIYQIGSADPDLAVQAAKTVLQDVSGIDLNCGCPKPFSTHSGMGAALLTNPDLLCSILTTLRRELPPYITVTAKIRLLPTQEDTLKLVERIVNTGVSAITVHCRTRNMRPRERALIERLREIVEFVEGMGTGIAVVANGDCQSYEDAKHVREMTGAHSVMIATAAESNPSCFSPTPLIDLERSLMPSYLRLCKYLDNHFSNTKFSALQFKGSHGELSKSERNRIHQVVQHARSFDDFDEIVVGGWDGEIEMQEIVRIIEARPSSMHSEMYDDTLNHTVLDPANANVAAPATTSDITMHRGTVTPPEKRENPVPTTLATPRLPPNERQIVVPAFVSGHDALTPTPSSSSIYSHAQPVA